MSKRKKDPPPPTFPINDGLRRFVADLFGGLHHAPREKSWDWESPTQVSMTVFAGGGWATFDGAMLTRIVLLAHARAVRVELNVKGFGYVELRLSQRVREGRMYERHPTIEEVANDPRCPWFVPSAPASAPAEEGSAGA